MTIVRNNPGIRLSISASHASHADRKIAVARTAWHRAVQFSWFDTLVLGLARVLRFAGFKAAGQGSSTHSMPRRVFVSEITERVPTSEPAAVFQPYVPATEARAEFTPRAVLLGGIFG